MLKNHYSNTYEQNETTVVQLQTQCTGQVHQVLLDSSTCTIQPRPLDMCTVSTLEQGLGFCPVIS